MSTCFAPIVSSFRSPAKMFLRGRVRSSTNYAIPLWRTASNTPARTKCRASSTAVALQAQEEAEDELYGYEGGYKSAESGKTSSGLGDISHHRIQAVTGFGSPTPNRTAHTLGVHPTSVEVAEYGQPSTQVIEGTVGEKRQRKLDTAEFYELETASIDDLVAVSFRFVLAIMK